MNPEQFQRLMAAFNDVVALPQHARQAALEHRFAGEPELQAEAHALLAEHDRVDGPVVTAAGVEAMNLGDLPTSGFPLPSRSLPPTPVLKGAYRLLRTIGEGGMGVVYEAQQVFPQRRVALKSIRPGLASNSMLRRFRTEVELLARLQHPGIAQIYEAGLADEDQPDQAFFVMELVEGEPLNRFARAANTTLRQRVELLRKVCDAVQHAHHRGVIHRDLKPGNILVTPQGQPKILDFGIARAADDTGDGTMATRAGQIVGTPSYMSPEQLAGEPVDTRTDVYALGVIAYEVLSGQLPLDFSRTPLVEASRTLREKKVPPLSRHDRLLRGDLDVIVSTAMHADKEQRYQSAAALAEDFARHLDGRPIAARRDSAAYVLSRLAKRHRGVVTLASVLLLTLLASGVWSWIIAAHNSRLAAQAEAARRVADAESAKLRSTLYSSRIGFAQAALATGDVARLRRVLDECPPDLRGWEWDYLDGASDDSVASFVVPPGDIANAAVLADGSAAFVAGSAGQLARIDLPSGKEAWRRDLAAPDIWAVTVSADGQSLTTFGTTGKVWIYRTSDGAAGPMIPNRDSPDSPTIGFRALRFLDRSQTLISGSIDGRLRIFEAATGKLVDSWQAHERDVATIDFSADGRYIFTCGTVDLTACIWDASTHKELARHRFAAGGPSVMCGTFSPDGATAAVALTDGRAFIWRWRDDPADPASVRTIQTSDRAVMAMDLSPDGSALAVGGRDAALRIFDTRSGQLIRTQNGEPDQFRSVRWPTPGLIITTGAFSRLRLWEPSPRPTPVRITIPDREAAGIAFLGDGRLAINGANGTWMASIHGDLGATPPAVAPGETGPRHGMAQLPDGTLVAAGRSGALRFMNAASGESSELPLGAGAVLCVAASRAGDLVVAGTTGGRIVTVRWPQRSIERSIDARGDAIYAVAFAPDGERVFAVANTRVFCWNLRTGEPATNPFDSGAALYSLAISPDGKLIAVVGESGTCRLLRADDLAPLPPPTGPVGTIHAARFIDSSRLAVGAADRTVRIINVHNGEELLALKGHSSSATWLAFDEKTRTLASGGRSGDVLLWEVPQNVQQPLK